MRCVIALCTLLAGPGLFAASNVVEYTRDAAGNIIAISRQGTASLAITGFSPTTGPVGTTVSISGTGFSPSPGSNAVAFNGTTASVTAQTSTSITTSVPTGATTGRITVTVGGITATSATDFVVSPANAPTIASFTPGNGIATTSVSVTGSNFDTSTGGTTVKLNGVAAVATVTSATALTFPVPENAGSGRITATTATGTGESSTDFIVPPSGISGADIIAKVRLAVDGAADTVTVGTANKHAMVLFDGAVDAYVSVQFRPFTASPNTGTVNYKVIAPNNVVIQTGAVGNAARPSIHLPKLPSSGTYSVLLSPGTTTLNTSVRVVTNPTLVVDNSATTTYFDYAYQSGRFLMTASAGQRIGLGVAGIAFVPASTTPPVSFNFFKPDGSSLTSVTCNGPATGNPQGNCDAEIVATVAGTYVVVVENPTGGYANMSLQLSSEVTGTLTPDVTADVVLARVGQDARYTFSATSGDSLGLDISASVPQPQAQNLTLNVLAPDGSTYRSCTLLPPAPSYCELGALPTTGSYSVVADPSFGAYGSFKLTLKQGGVLGTTDSPAAFAPAAVPEAARFRLVASAGQNLTVGVTDLAYVGTGSTTFLSVYRPDRSSVGSANCLPTTASGRCKLTLTNLAAGTYSVVIAPPAGVRISGNVSASADIAGTLVSGTPQTINAARPGQNARFDFSGTTGDSTSVKLYGVTTTPASQNVVVAVYAPNTALVASGTTFGGSLILNLPSLTQTGTYKVVLEPQYGVTWQGTLALDPGALIAVNDPATVLATSVAGEPLRLRISGTSGQRLEFGLSGLTYGSASSNATGFNLYRPDGVSVMTDSCLTAGAGTCEKSVASLPSTGTYSAIFIPPSASSITQGSVYFSTPAVGTFVVSDPAQTVAITRPGQTARYTFAGTSGQLLRLNWSSATVSGSATVAVTVLKPDGSTLNSMSIVNGATSGADVTSLPSSGTYTVVFDPSAAATMSASVALVTR